MTIPLDQIMFRYGMAIPLEQIMFRYGMAIPIRKVTYSSECIVTQSLSPGCVLLIRFIHTPTLPPSS